MTDITHYARRAERHRRLAAQAGNPAVRAAHEQLAAAYEAMASPDAKTRSGEP